jgi:hypothetical protein
MLNVRGKGIANGACALATLHSLSSASFLTSNGMKEAIFVAEKHRRPHNHRLGKFMAQRSFAFCTTP